MVHRQLQSSLASPICPGAGPLAPLYSLSKYPSSGTVWPCSSMWLSRVRPSTSSADSHVFESTTSDCFHASSLPPLLAPTTSVRAISHARVALLYISSSPVWRYCSSKKISTRSASSSMLSPAFMPSMSSALRASHVVSLTAVANRCARRSRKRTADGSLTLNAASTPSVSSASLPKSSAIAPMMGRAAVRKAFTHCDLLNTLLIKSPRPRSSCVLILSTTLSRWRRNRSTTTSANRSSQRSVRRLNCRMMRRCSGLSYSITRTWRLRSGSSSSGSSASSSAGSSAGCSSATGGGSFGSASITGDRLIGAHHASPHGKPSCSCGNSWGMNSFSNGLSGTPTAKRSRICPTISARFSCRTETPEKSNSATSACPGKRGSNRSSSSVLMNRASGMMHMVHTAFSAAS